MRVIFESFWLGVCPKTDDTARKLIWQSLYKSTTNYIEPDYQGTFNQNSSWEEHQRNMKICDCEKRHCSVNTAAVKPIHPTSRSHHNLHPRPGEAVYPPDTVKFLHPSDVSTVHDWYHVQKSAPLKALPHQR